MDTAKIHLEINAGKCIYDGNTVKPDKRKGKLVLYKICDNLYNFQWINRENNKVEDNLILTKSISLEKVEQCKTGRVYILRNKLRGEISFYWMQDYDDSKDEAFVKKFNSIIANDLAKDVGNKRRYNSSDYASELTDLIFSQNRNIQNVDSKKAVSFKDLFVSEYFSKLLEIPEAFEELKKHMPEGYQNKYDIVDLINSRALTPNLRSLDMSLPSHLNFILISLNLPPHEGQINDPMEYIVECLENKYKNEENN
ncbi:26S proteasome regulatory subunit RPN13 [Plasmodium brasilianum]|uniref:26S proteasome regulatory subunit RPN13, putative n=2 Tax=Plasmodium (Plasmodium) TaxID=418103 RepID=A0A1C3KFI7_PLAMA|nr:26S proteasome regulatory subunit RPN13, putative [Plasmodium malariae]KAI4835861.1 26S proteasome regulatory subunit RPN13 [Plasmodium brasilianum]SBT72412.1 26S proteasome regulatory subunit RPN13, putative [Plasmodium malariae]SCP02797.1 26S proteasome regulatory subunit RPN13, putative [Plasmodium malariae]